MNTPDNRAKRLPASELENLRNNVARLAVLLQDPDDDLQSWHESVKEARRALAPSALSLVDPGRMTRRQYGEIRALIETSEQLTDGLRRRWQEEEQLHFALEMLARDPQGSFNVMVEIHTAGGRAVYQCNEVQVRENLRVFLASRAATLERAWGAGS